MFFCWMLMLNITPVIFRFYNYFPSYKIVMKCGQLPWSCGSSMNEVKYEWMHNLFHSFIHLGPDACRILPCTYVCADSWHEGVQAQTSWHIFCSRETDKHIVMLSHQQTYCYVAHQQTHCYVCTPTYTLLCWHSKLLLCCDTNILLCWYTNIHTVMLRHQQTSKLNYWELSSFQWQHMCVHHGEFDYQ